MLHVVTQMYAGRHIRDATCLLQAAVTHLNMHKDPHNRFRCLKESSQGGLNKLSTLGALLRPTFLSSLPPWVTHGVRIYPTREQYPRTGNLMWTFSSEAPASITALPSCIRRFCEVGRVWFRDTTGTRAIARAHRHRQLLSVPCPTLNLEPLGPRLGKRTETTPARAHHTTKRL